MKKIITILLTITILMGIMLPVAEADNAQITVTINGQQIQFDQPPVIIDGRTLVPLRAIFEGLGATVDWEEETQTVTATKIKTGGFLTTGIGGVDGNWYPLIANGGTIINVSINDNRLYVNDDIVNLDVPAQIINNRTLVPVRAVSESFGCKVDWDEKNKTVKIENEIFLPCEISLTQYGVSCSLNITYGEDGNEIYAEDSYGEKIKVTSTNENVEILAEAEQGDIWKKIICDTNGNFVYSDDHKDWHIEYNDKLYSDPYIRDKSCYLYAKENQEKSTRLSNKEYDAQGTLIYAVSNLDIPDLISDALEWEYDDNGNLTSVIVKDYSTMKEYWAVKIKYTKVKIRPNVLKSIAWEAAQELLFWQAPDLA